MSDRPPPPSKDAPAIDSRALDQLRHAAETGSHDAMFQLGNALVAQGRADEALRYYRQAAHAGHAAAQIEWARGRLYGIDAPADPGEAVHWLQCAQATGHPAAGYLLALVALGDTASGSDSATFARINAWMLDAIRHDLPPALRAAAIHFGRRAADDDQTRCLQLLERAAGRGDIVAARLLAERLARGEGCPRQPEAAAALWQQLAQHGVPRLPAIEAPTSPPLEARVAGTLAFEESLRVPASAQLSERPAVRRIDGLLSADECRLLAASAQPLLQPSMTLDPVSGAPIANPVRTSHDASFDPLREDFVLRLVQLRMARAAGLPLVHAEQLIVLRYAPGQEYRPHRDYLPPARLSADRPEAGNRRRTICVYLNEVAAGGATVFPEAGLEIAPAAGRAVVFDNLDAEGRPDADSLHAGQPVVSGEKWLATLWMRERPYRTF